jgi:hypothetical protein
MWFPVPVAYIQSGATSNAPAITEKALRPVQPVAGERPLLPLVEVNLDPVAVELDFMDPLVAGRRLCLQRGHLRFDESRHFRRRGRRSRPEGRPGLSSQLFTSPERWEAKLCSLLRGALESRRDSRPSGLGRRPGDGQAPGRAPERCWTPPTREPRLRGRFDRPSALRSLAAKDGKVRQSRIELFLFPWHPLAREAARATIPDFGGHRADVIVLAGSGSGRGVTNNIAA